MPGDSGPDRAPGLGVGPHLAIQYADAFGMETVALSRSPDKRELAEELGADRFVNAAEQDAAEALQELGGASLIVATAPSAEAMSSVVPGLGRNGELRVNAAVPDPFDVPPLALIQNRANVQGWPSGTAVDSEDTVAFSERGGIRVMVDTFGLKETLEAYHHMLQNDARFRSVLDLTN